jgi:hypothetical protein
MRIVRLLTVVFVLILSVTALSAAPRSSGSFSRPGKGKLHASMTQSDWSYYCYRDGISKPCGGYDDCLNECLIDCGPPCTYEGDAINN